MTFKSKLSFGRTIVQHWASTKRFSPKLKAHRLFLASCLHFGQNRGRYRHRRSKEQEDDVEGQVLGTMNKAEWVRRAFVMMDWSVWYMYQNYSVPFGSSSNTGAHWGRLCPTNRTGKLESVYMYLKRWSQIDLMCLNLTVKKFARIKRNIVAAGQWY